VTAKRHGSSVIFHLISC